jgi:perosamine synthetase
MIRLIRPYISFAEVEAEFRAVFESGILTKGINVEAFREAIRAYTGSGNCFLTTSATTALTMCLKLLEIGPGDEVVVSDFSFPASANVVEDVGARPVFADVDRATYNMLPEQLERRISAKTKAVMFVDALGNPSGITRIAEICRARGIPLIEDAACAIGSAEAGKRCGSIADLSCFSFHPRKLLTTGEGGAITTNNKDYAEKLDVKLNHGSVHKNGKFDFVDYGYNYRLPELQAIMGVKQLQKLDRIVVERSATRIKYIKYLSPLGFVPQAVAPGVVYNVQSVVFVVPNRLPRDYLIAELKKCEIETTLGTYCLSNTTYFRNKYKNVQEQACFLQENTITLPCYEGVDAKTVCQAIERILAESPREAIHQ